MKPVQLPSGYEVLCVLGEGCFGKVLKCWRKDIKQTVAVKIPKCFHRDSINEVSMLRRFKLLRLEQHNIVEFIDCFQTKHGKAMVFEVLDISLENYLAKTGFAPMRLLDIRTIIQQMAKAFDALKGIGVIHSDVHLHNIMMVNHRRRPFRIKLIDFGLAISRSEASQGARLQPLAYRSPEILLGCPFSEAIDMWSLGCLLFVMICGKLPFKGRSEHAQMQRIIDILGQPADRLLNAGIKTKDLFKRTDSNSWELKTSFEFSGQHLNSVNKDHKRQSLDNLKEMRLEENNKTEAAEREQCIELLKAMLKVDADERITPCEVLSHPFIKDYHYPNNGALAAASPRRTTEQSKQNLEKILRPTKSALSPKKRPALTKTWPSSTLTWVQPAAATLTQTAATPLKEDQGSKVSGSSYIFNISGSTEFTLPSEDFRPDDCTPSPTFLPSGVILVWPATAENTLMQEGQGSEVSGRTYIFNTSGTSAFTSSSDGFEPAAPRLTDDDVINVRPDNCTPSPTFLPSGVILVRPATAENTLMQEGQGSEVSGSTYIFNTSGTSAFTSSSEGFDCAPAAPRLTDDDVINVRPDNCTPSPTFLPSGVILVRPATVENTLLEDQESAVSFQCGLKETSGSSVTNTERSMKSSICEDSGSCENTGAKKKKTRFRRVFSWMRKTFGSCCTCAEED